MKHLTFPIRLSPTRADVREEVRARLAGLEYWQKVREDRRRRLAEKAMIRKQEKNMLQTGETALR